MHQSLVDMVHKGVVELEDILVMVAMVDMIELEIIPPMDLVAAVQVEETMVLTRDMEVVEQVSLERVLVEL